MQTPNYHHSGDVNFIFFQKSIIIVKTGIIFRLSNLCIHRLSAHLCVYHSHCVPAWTPVARRWTAEIADQSICESRSTRYFNSWMDCSFTDRWRQVGL